MSHVYGSISVLVPPDDVKTEGETVMKEMKFYVINHKK